MDRMPPLVSFRDVQKTYRSLQGADYAAVEHFGVDIEAGEFFCLLGPSGCGKTTTTTRSSTRTSCARCCRRR